MYSQLLFGLAFVHGNCIGTCGFSMGFSKKKGELHSLCSSHPNPPRAHDVGIRHITIVRADLRPSSGLEAVAVKLFLVSGHVACAPN